MNFASRISNAAPAIRLADEKEFRLGVLLVRPSTREIVVDGRAEIVEPRVMQVLVVLAQACGAVVSRNRLIERCWGGRIVGDDAINNCVGKVRGLASLTCVPAFEVETVPKVGYRLLVKSPGGNPAPSGTPAPPAGANGAGHSRRWLGRQSRKAALAAGLGIAAVATATLLSRPFGPANDRAMPGFPARPTAAVLPFTPLYSDRSVGAYADEISSDVADTLGQTDLNVISPALSFRFRGDGKAGAARTLHADILVDGSVRREGDTLNVSVRVDDVASGLVLVSTNIAGPVAQAGELSDQVATSIAGALGWDVSIKALNSSRRWDPRVRTAILRAVFQCPHRQDPFCAYEVGREMVGVAPDNPIAQTILAIETTDILDRLPERERKPAADRARRAAWTAIRLDPHFGEPYIALSQLAADRAQNESYLRRGLAADPDSSSVAAYLSALLYSSGRIDEGLAVLQRVSARYKFEDWASTNRIWALLGQGRRDEAVEIARRARRLWPDTELFVVMLFDAAAFGGDPAGAQALLNDPVTGPILHAPGDSPTIVHLVRALRSRSAQDIAALSNDCAREPRPWVRAHFCVVALAMLGRIDDAFRVPPNEAGELVLFWPQTAPLRADPRFQKVAEKLGLMAYWKAVRVRPDFCAREHAPVCRALAPKHA